MTDPKDRIRAIIDNNGIYSGDRETAFSQILELIREARIEELRQLQEWMPVQGFDDSSIIYMIEVRLKELEDKE